MMVLPALIVGGKSGLSRGMTHARHKVNDVNGDRSSSNALAAGDANDAYTKAKDKP